jgi:Pentapeptide repeats (8 copies)
MTSAPTPPPETWKEHQELRLRRTEVHAQKWNGIAQAVLSVATVALALVALWTALQSQQSLKNATLNNLQQAQDDQFSTALTSLGSSDVTERIAGLELLELNVADRLTPTSTAAFGKTSAYNYYTTALAILSGYLQGHGVGSTTTGCPANTTQLFGLGYGALPCKSFSIDTQYAVDTVSKMLGLKNQVDAVSSEIPAFDLANDELYQVNFKEMDLSWVNVYMVGIDLRGGELEKVHMSKLDDAGNSHLQCADLQYADLQGANLTDANLSGANLHDADLQGANLTGANLQGAYVSGANFSRIQDSQATLSTMYFSPNDPPIGLPTRAVTASGKPQIQSLCLAKPSYWDSPVC